MNSPFFDPTQEIKRTRGSSLPHWCQEGKIIFVTFRLADSLPLSMANEISLMEATFRKHNPEPWDAETRNRFRNIKSRHVERLLDNGHGSCVLRKPEVRQILEDTFRYNDGNTYELLAYVLMPNHVHCLLALGDQGDLGSVLRSIKNFSERQINRLLNTRGQLWDEGYDRIVRSEDHLKHCINYIRDNPLGLHPDEYSLYFNY